MSSKRNRTKRRPQQRVTQKERRSVEENNISSGNINKLILGVMLLVCTAMKGDGKDIKKAKKYSTKSQESAKLQKPVEKEFNFKPVPGMLTSLPPVETCGSINDANFARSGTGEKFIQVMNNCEGNLQSNGQTSLKCTIPGFRINGALLIQLENIFKQTGVIGKNTLKFNKRTFVFHREDGKDGIPLEKKTDFEATFTPQAKTQAERHVSHSLTNIPLSGDKLDDISGLATEICQTLVIPKYPKDPYKSEIICNSYGFAVRNAYAEKSYREYKDLTGRMTFYIKEEGGKKLKFEIVSQDTYRKLQAALMSKPDILERKY